MRKCFVYFCLILALMSFFSCKKATSSSSNTSSYAPSCNATKSYSIDVKPIIQSNCVSCHSQYSNYNGLNTDKSSIRSEVYSGSMPNNSTLSSTQKDAIICWIDAGASNN